MRRIIILIAILLCSVTMVAQTYKVGKNNELVSVSSPSDSITNVKTKFTITKSGVKYPVWKSKRGKYFIVRTSKTTGNVYKQYLKIESL